jgi:hypothetical protein
MHNLLKLFLSAFMLTSSINSFAQPWALAAENQISLISNSISKIKKQNLESVEQAKKGLHRNDFDFKQFELNMAYDSMLLLHLDHALIDIAILNNSAKIYKMIPPSSQQKAATELIQKQMKITHTLLSASLIQVNSVLHLSKNDLTTSNGKEIIIQIKNSQDMILKNFLTPDFFLP